jgi:hypothetical protein
MAAAPRLAPDAETVAAAAAALLSALAVARALSDRGRRVDLAGLDREAAALCIAALALPPEEGRRLRPRLSAIAAEAAALQRRLRPG